MIARLSDDGLAARTLAEPDAVGERAYRRIRTDIIFGHLRPGQKLKLHLMRERYGASISTVRELLNRLTSEGFVVAEGLRGFEVTPASADDFRELAAMRELLECRALEQSFALGDMDWEACVVAAHHKLTLMEKRMLAGNRGEAETWKRYDREFHQALISACGSNALREAHGAIYDRYLRYQMIAVVFRGAMAAREHQELLQLALRRDTAAAQAVWIKHIQDCVKDTAQRGLLP